MPLELPLVGVEKYESTARQMVGTYNSGRTAAYVALKDFHPSKIYIPHYNCKVCEDPINDLGIAFEFYYLDDHLLPKDIALKADEMLWWVNYFGNASDEQIDFLSEKYKNQLIIDNCQAFFSRPRLKSYNIYSCRKFFGVSDGAYLIKDYLNQVDLEKDSSYKRANFLLKTIEEGTDGAYADNLNNEQRLNNSYLKMSKLTKRILQSIRYDKIQQKRKQNFEQMHAYFNAINEFSMNSGSNTHMFYPLVVNKPALREHLIQHRIYVPTLWRHVPEQSGFSEIETRLSTTMFALPIDQRYDEAAISEICDVVQGQI